MPIPSNNNQSNYSMTPLHYLRFGCADLSGWLRRGVLLLLGLCMSLAMPPLYLWPLLLIALPCLIWITDAAPNRKAAFGAGWWFGMGYFVSMIYWFAVALLVDAEAFGWLIPFAVFGLGGILAIYTGILTYAYHRLLGGRPLWQRWLGFSVLWIAVEALRAHLFTGFPWNLLGYTWTASNLTIQGGYYVGIYGLSFLTALLATLPVLWAAGKFVAERRIAYGTLTLAASFIALCGWRLDQAPPLAHLQPGAPDTQTFRLVQGNIEQQLKWTPEGRFEAIRRYAALTRSTGFEQVNHVIWPESAMTFPFNSGDALAQELATLAPANGYLLTGVTRVEAIVSKLANMQGKFRLFNSLQVVDEQANVVATYDKRHLVPFGEYIPLRWLLPFEKKITHGMMDFSSGRILQSSTELDNIPSFLTLICYEAIFPALAAPHQGHAKLLINITNDAWFGHTAAPHQHLQMTRMRAVEQATPLLRAANTGITTAFDAYGREMGRLPLGVSGVLDITLPRSTAQ
jgi:apolipoprotein N-acyltransferase